MLDFLKMTERPPNCDVPLSNPPYRKAMQYIERYERLYKLGHLRRIHVLAERLQDMHDANFTGEKASQSQVHAWFVLDRDYRGPATMNPVSIHRPVARMPWLSGKKFC